VGNRWFCLSEAALLPPAPRESFSLGVAWSHGFEVDVLARKRDDQDVAVTALAKLDATGPESLFERRIGQVVSSDHGQPVLRVISPADSPDARVQSLPCSESLFRLKLRPSSRSPCDDHPDGTPLVMMARRSPFPLRERQTNRPGARGKA
jgi:hypothetical protein